MSMTFTRRSMTRALARSSSVSLVLPLASPQQKSTILCTLRRAQSSIPAIEYCVVDTSNKNNKKQQAGDLPGNGDGDHHSDFGRDYHSDYGSCDSSIQDLFDVVDEPKRVSKEILRSVSLSFQWLDVPLHEFELPTRREDTDMTISTMSDLEQQQEQPIEIVNTGVRDDTLGLAVGRQGSLRFAYIHECQTGRSVVSHVELKTAMDNLGQWTMQVPRNCCLSYRHETSGEVATLPWPDLEAGGMDEIEEFVSMVNRIEKRPVFFPRYQRSAFEVPKSLSSISSSCTDGHTIVRTVIVGFAGGTLSLRLSNREDSHR